MISTSGAVLLSLIIFLASLSAMFVLVDTFLPEKYANSSVTAYIIGALSAIVTIQVWLMLTTVA